MTGGTVVVLGGTGRNFAAGMSGGIAYVYDEDGAFASRCNMAMVALDPVLSVSEQETTLPKSAWHSLTRGGERQTDEAMLKSLIERHFKYTGSTRARTLLDDWSAARNKFIKVFPTEYKRALGEMFAAAGKVAEKVTA
jgi:glutamate synthase (NADPH/NADH) large chain